MCPCVLQSLAGHGADSRTRPENLQLRPEENSSRSREQLQQPTAGWGSGSDCKPFLCKRRPPTPTPAVSEPSAWRRRPSGKPTLPAAPGSGSPPSAIVQLTPGPPTPSRSGGEEPEAEPHFPVLPSGKQGARQNPLTPEAQNFDLPEHCWLRPQETRISRPVHCYLTGLSGSPGL